MLCEICKNREATLKTRGRKNVCTECFTLILNEPPANEIEDIKTVRSRRNCLSCGSSNLVYGKTGVNAPVNSLYYEEFRPLLIKVPGVKNYSVLQK